MAVLIFISECRLFHYSEGCTHGRLWIWHWWTVLLFWWNGQNRGNIHEVSNKLQT